MGTLNFLSNTLVFICIQNLRHLLIIHLSLFSDETLIVSYGPTQILNIFYFRFFYLLQHHYVKQVTIPLLCIIIMQLHTHYILQVQPLDFTDMLMSLYHVWRRRLCFSTQFKINRLWHLWASYLYFSSSQMALQRDYFNEDWRLNHLIILPGRFHRCHWRMSWWGLPLGHWVPSWDMYHQFPRSIPGFLWTLLPLWWWCASCSPLLEDACIPETNKIFWFFFISKSYKSCQLRTEQRFENWLFPPKDSAAELSLLLFHSSALCSRAIHLLSIH